MQNKKIVMGLLLKDQPPKSILRAVFKMLTDKCPDPDYAQKIQKACCFQDILSPLVIRGLNQFEIADTIRAAVMAYPEWADYLCEELPHKLRHNWEGNDMYQDRKMREGFLLGLLESVIIMQEHCEDQGFSGHMKFQKSWPAVAYQLAFSDGTNWDIKDKRMEGRLANAISNISSGYGGNRELRIGQLVGLARAMHMSSGIWIGGWHHTIARNFAYGLFGCQFEQGQLELLVNNYSRSEYKEFEIPKNLLKK